MRRRRGSSGGEAADDADLTDLEGLCVVSRREFRRGYVTYENGERRRFRYVKVMDAYDGGVVVHEPPPGAERAADRGRRAARSVGMVLLLSALPLSVIVACVLVAVLT